MLITAQALCTLRLVLYMFVTPSTVYATQPAHFNSDDYIYKIYIYLQFIYNTVFSILNH